MHFNTYGGNAARLAAALVNTATGGAGTATLDGVLTTHRVIGTRLTGPEATELDAWAGRLREVFTAAPPARVAILNTLLAEVAARPFISTHDGLHPHLHYHPDDAPITTRVKATTAGGLATLLVDAGAERLGSCAASGCDTVFVDVSRNGRRTYCSPRCATRVNVAAHRSRTRPR